MLNRNNCLGWDDSTAYAYFSNKDKPLESKYANEQNNKNINEAYGRKSNCRIIFVLFNKHKSMLFSHALLFYFISAVFIYSVK